jgi:hypothetical protein
MTHLVLFAYYSEKFELSEEGYFIQYFSVFFHFLFSNLVTDSYILVLLNYLWILIFTIFAKKKKNHISQFHEPAIKYFRKHIFYILLKSIILALFEGIFLPCTSD